MKLIFAGLVDIPKLQELMDGLYSTTGIPSGIVDVDGTILTTTGWQDICTKFHRVCPETERLCRESEKYILEHLHSGSCIGYRCQNSMLDYACPIVVEENHLATLFLGQFFFEPPDENIFRQQAKKYGFDERAYLEALRRVPIIPEAKLELILKFYRDLADMLADMGMRRLKHLRAYDALQKSKEKLNQVIEGSNDGFWDCDLVTGAIEISPRLAEMLGYRIEEIDPHIRFWQKLVHPDDKLTVANSLIGHLRGKLIQYEAEYRLLTKAGEWKWILARGKVSVRDEDGKPLRMAGTHTDITERKRGETVLREQKRLIEKRLAYANAINRIDDVIVSNDDTQTILQSMTNIVGEILGADRSLIYHVDFKAGRIFGLCEWNRNTPGIFCVRNDWDLNLFRNLVEYMADQRKWVQTHLDDVNELFIKDKSDQYVHKIMGVKSALYYPFAFHPQNYYALIFHQFGRRREWREEELGFIGVVAKQVEIAIQKIHLLDERRKAQQAIWEEKERAQVTLQSIGDAVITTDAEGNVEYLNSVAENLTGWKNDEAKGKPLPVVFDIINENTGGVVENPVTKCIREGRIVGLANHTVLIHRGGYKFAIEDSASPIKNREGQIIGAVLVFHDVSEKRQLLKQMIHQAYHDPLTGLSNRILFNDRLSLALAHAHRHKEMLAVLFIDLDRFKLVNDMMGHAKGDKMLKEVADRLVLRVRESDTIARLGGDEFTILLPQISHEEDAAKVAQKVLQDFQEPWTIDEQEFLVTASIGIAFYPNDGEDAETLLKYADTAMYRAKDRGRNNYQLYTPAMNVKIMERLKMENNLRRALKQGELTVFYQPQVNTKTGRITGVEALVRWNHPDRGLFFPSEFIPLAEDTGLIVPLGEWVMRAACAQNKAWQDEGLCPIRVTVNISARHFAQQNLVETIAHVLELTGLDPNWLELEITESALMKDVDFAIKTLYELKNMGVRISIDDFGTGYSSLNYLKRFPIHTLKIDRSFVRDIMGKLEDAAIVSTIIVLAQNLNLKVIAEGVETEQQLNFLKQRQCYDMQGYYFSRPIPAEDFKILLNREKLL